jgi:hypothetical protein
MNSEQVGGKKLVLVDLEDLSNLHVLPLGLDKNTVANHLTNSVVFLIIFLMTQVIFVGIFDHTNQDDKAKGW